MKRFMSLFVGLSLALTLTACGGEQKKQEEPAKNDKAQTEVKQENTTQEKTTPEKAKEEQKTQELKIGDEFKVGDYGIKVNSVRRAKDESGKPAIIVNYSYTNNSKSAHNPMGSVKSTVMQDKYKLAYAIVKEGMVADNYMKQVESGQTLNDCEQAFVAISENPIEINFVPVKDDKATPQIVKTDMPK